MYNPRSFKIQDMKKLNKPYVMAAFVCCLGLTVCTSCEDTDKEPPVNAGYKTNIRMPDAEDLSTEDLELIERQQAEYDQNKNNI